jgi:hypothetical protein
MFKPKRIIKTIIINHKTIIDGVDVDALIKVTGTFVPEVYGSYHQPPDPPYFDELAFEAVNFHPDHLDMVLDEISKNNGVRIDYYASDMLLYDNIEEKNTIFNVYENYQREWDDEVGKCYDVSHRYVSSHKTKEGAEKYINDRLEETASSLEKIVKALENYQDNIETVAEDLVQIKMIRNNQELLFKGDLELTLPKYFVEEYELGD